MSKPRRETITCPDCGAEREVVIWETLNAEMSPAEKNQLTEGELFKFRCECGYCAEIDYALLYHDMTHRVMVYYVHEDEAEKVEEIFEKTVLPKDVGMDGYKFRIVHSKNELREKAIIFDNNLDDHVISILKVVCCAHFFEEYPDDRIDEVLFFEDEGKWKLQIIGSKVGMMDIPEDFYNYIQAKYADKLKNEKESYYIDYSWGKEFLTGK